MINTNYILYGIPNYYISHKIIEIITYTTMVCWNKLDMSFWTSGHILLYVLLLAHSFYYLTELSRQKYKGNVS
jgi:hypothetical protein